MVLAAKQGLTDNLDAITAAVAYARELGPLLATILGVTINPTTPQAAMFHLHIECSEADLLKRIADYETQQDIMVLPAPRAFQHGRCVCEISVASLLALVSPRPKISGLILYRVPPMVLEPPHVAFERVL